MSRERFRVGAAEVADLVSRVPVGLLEDLEDRLGRSLADLQGEGRSLGQQGRAINYLILAARDPDTENLWDEAGRHPMPEIVEAEDASAPVDPSSAGAGGPHLVSGETRQSA